MIDWSGIFHILATPFTDDAALDLAGVPRLVEAVLATGVRDELTELLSVVAAS